MQLNRLGIILVQTKAYITSLVLVTAEEQTCVATILSLSDFCINILKIVVILSQNFTFLLFFKFQCVSEIIIDKYYRNNFH